MEIVINDMVERIVVKFIVKYNQPLSATPSKSRLPKLHFAVHRVKAVPRLVCSLNTEGTDLSHIARVYKAADGWTEQNVTIH